MASKVTFQHLDIFQNKHQDKVTLLNTNIFYNVRSHNSIAARYRADQILLVAREEKLPSCQGDNKSFHSIHQADRIRISPSHQASYESFDTLSQIKSRMPIYK